MCSVPVWPFISSRGEHGALRKGEPKDTAGRLQELEDLRGRGLISDDEHERLRADMLRDL